MRAVRRAQAHADPAVAHEVLQALGAGASDTIDEHTAKVNIQDKDELQTYVEYFEPSDTIEGDKECSVALDKQLSDTIDNVASTSGQS